jgi:hypothetical protein
MPRLIALLLALSLCLIAADAPTSPSAKAALSKLEKAKADAKREYDAAVAKATKEAVEALEAAKGQAMKAGNLEEANRIQEAITGLGSAVSDRRVDGTWDVQFAGSTVRRFRFEPDGTVHGFDDGKWVRVGELSRKGDWWEFTDGRFGKVRRVQRTDGLMIVANFHKGSSELESFAIGTPVGK